MNTVPERKRDAMEDKNISTAPEIPGKLQEFCHFFTGPWKTPGKQLFSLYSWNSPGILWRIILFCE